MKILLLITKTEIGGAQSFVANLAKGLKDGGEEVIVASGQGTGWLVDFAQNNNINFKLISGLERSSNPFKFIQFLFNLYKLIIAYKPDIVHFNSSNTLLGAISAKLANKCLKTIFTLHGLSVLDNNCKINKLKKLVYKAYFKFCFKFIDNLVFVSQKNLDLAISQKLVKKADLIYNGIKSNFLDRETARKEIFSKLDILDDNIFLIGSIGRLDYPKNYEFLLSNFDKIQEIKPNSKLIIIGEGPERPKYEQIIKEKSLENFVFLLGSIPDASRYLRAFDLFILPSIYEGLSISLIEARNACIQIIASDVGGNSEVMGQENCYKLDDLADFINIFKEKISAEQKNCTEEEFKENRFDLDKMISSYEYIYRD